MQIIDKNSLIEALKSALAPLVEAYQSIESAEEVAFKSEFARIQAMIDAEKNPVIKNALRQSLKEITSKRPDASATRRADLAEAIGVAAASFKISLNGPIASPTVSGKRVSKFELSAAVEKVYGALRGDAFLSKGNLVAATGLDSKIVLMALLKLKAAKKIISNGRRGPAGAYKRA